MTSSVLALERVSLVLNRPWILEKSFAFEDLISPITASISSWEVTRTQARPSQILPRSSTIV